MRRILILALVVPLAFLAWRNAALGYWRAAGSAPTPQYLTGDPYLKVLRADAWVLNEPARLAAESASVRRNASDALVQAPLNSTALRQLGVLADLKQSGTGHANLVLAERISRRDLANQLLLINSAARRGDIQGTLAHYDRALLVYPSSSATLFPILARAIAEPEIKDGLTRYVRRPWFAGFLGTALDKGADTSSVMALLAAVQKSRTSREGEALASALLGQLVSRGEFAAARTLAGRLSDRPHEGVGFSEATTDSRLALLNWRLANDDAITTTLVGGKELGIAVSSERTGIVAERVTLLAPGVYAVAMELHYAEGEPRARLAWDVRCLAGSPAAPLWQLAPAPAVGRTRYEASLTVPDGCEAQAWRLSATADMTQRESTAAITRLSLERQWLSQVTNLGLGKPD